MAERRFRATSGEISSGHGGEKTTFLIKVPAGEQIKLNEWRHSNKGSDATKPQVHVALYKATAAGTLGGDGTTVTPQKIGHGFTSKCTVYRARSDDNLWTAEPTPAAGSNLDGVEVPVVSRDGWAGIPMYFGDPSSDVYVGIRVNNGDAAGVVGESVFDWSEC